MSRCIVDLWPLDLKLLPHFGCHAFKLCTKFEQNVIIHRWVIDDLARFRRAIIGNWARHDKRFSGVPEPNFAKLGEDIGRSFLPKKCVLAFGYLAAFSNTRGLKLSYVVNAAEFRTFWPPLKIRWGWARSLYQLLKHDRTSEIHLMAIHCVAAEHGGL